MIELDSTTTNSAVIKVIGIGGGGGNAINTMLNEGLEGVEFISANTDIQALANNLSPIKIQLGRELTKGLGAGSNPEVGGQAAVESKQEIAELLKGSDMVFITAGMGGGTGTGATPVIAKIAKELGILTVGIVTKPFSFEGRKRLKKALQGIDELKKCVDTLITIPNQKLLALATPNTTMKDAFAMADQVLLNAVQGISDIINLRGEINVDFADVRSTMSEQGLALMGIGVASGENRAIEAACQAISSPLLEEMAIDGATGILINITGSNDMKLMEINEAAMFIEEKAHEDANIIFGSAFDESLEDKLRVTVIATGFDKQEEEEVPTYKATEQAQVINPPPVSPIMSKTIAETPTPPSYPTPESPAKNLDLMNLEAQAPKEAAPVEIPPPVPAEISQMPEVEQVETMEEIPEIEEFEPDPLFMNVNVEAEREIMEEESHEEVEEVMTEPEPQPEPEAEEIFEENLFEEPVQQHIAFKLSEDTNPSEEVADIEPEEEESTPNFSTSHLSSTMELINQKKIPIDKVLGNEELDIPTFLRKPAKDKGTTIKED